MKVSSARLPLPVVILIAVAGPAGLFVVALFGEVLSTQHRTASLVGLALVALLWIAVLIWIFGNGEATLAEREQAARGRLRLAEEASAGGGLPQPRA
jgi:cbb3-type cytochrome oxidase subunit 3